MDGALIDDRRVRVDFSQSVAKEWNRYRRREPMRREEAGELLGQGRGPGARAHGQGRAAPHAGGGARFEAGRGRGWQQPAG